MSEIRVRGTVGVELYKMYGVKETVGVGLLWTSAWNPEDINSRHQGAGAGIVWVSDWSPEDFKVKMSSAGKPW